MQSKELVELYTLISIFILIDTFLGGNIAKLVDFLRISRKFAYFWKLNFQISHKLQKEFEKLSYIIIEGFKGLLLHSHLNFILPLKITKFEKIVKKQALQNSKTSDSSINP